VTDFQDGSEQACGYRPDNRPVHTRAVEALYQSHGVQLEAFLTGVLRDRHQASEIVQTVYRKALEHLKQVSSDTEAETAGKSGATVDALLSNWGNPRGWLFRVGWNEAMLMRRVQTRHRNILEQAVWNRDLARSGSDHPDFRLIRDETVEVVRQAIQGLPEEQRDVVFRRIYREQTFAVISEELGIPLGTVLTRMRLAMQKLERALSSHDDMK